MSCDWLTSGEMASVEEYQAEMANRAQTIKAQQEAERAKAKRKLDKKKKSGKKRGSNDELPAVNYNYLKKTHITTDLDEEDIRMALEKHFESKDLPFTPHESKVEWEYSVKMQSLVPSIAGAESNS